MRIFLFIYLFCNFFFFQSMRSTICSCYLRSGRGHGRISRSNGDDRFAAKPPLTLPLKPGPVDIRNFRAGVQALLEAVSHFNVNDSDGKKIRAKQNKH